MAITLKIHNTLARLTIREVSSKTIFISVLWGKLLGDTIIITDIEQTAIVNL